MLGYHGEAYNFASCDKYSNITCKQLGVIYTFDLSVCVRISFASFMELVSLHG